MFKVLVPAVAALGLVAFAAQTETRVETPSVVPMGWHLSHEGAIAKLAYGVENSDQLALMLTCMPGDASAVVYGDVRPAGGGVTRVSVGPMALDPLSGGEAVETRVSLNDAGLSGLAARGAMDVQGEAGVFTVAADRQERRAVGEFLAYCRQARA